MGGMLPSMMNSQNRRGEEVREMAHERVTQLPKMSAISHLFSEDICWIRLAGDMNDLEGLVLNPLTN
jgi:hypothetical protein